MDHWTQLLRKLFTAAACVKNVSKAEQGGSRRRRSKAQRAQPTVKLELQSLEQRDLPSASPLVPPVVADMASQMVSTVDQWTRQIVAIQNELNSAWMALAQDLNQAVVASLSSGTIFSASIQASRIKRSARLYRS